MSTGGNTTPEWAVFVNNTQLEIAVFSVSGVFAVLSLLLTLYLIFRHLKHWIDPPGQACIVRIVALVPVYALHSCGAVLFNRYAIYFTLVRDCYEAYVLYQFFCLMTHYVNVEAPFLVQQLEEHDEIRGTGDYLQYLQRREDGAPVEEQQWFYPCPLCCVTMTPDRALYRRVKRLVLQYVLVKPSLAVLSITLYSVDWYEPGNLHPNNAYLWITLLQNISVTASLYGIVIFCDLTRELIHMYSPLAKLISIKVLLFFIFWQSVLLSGAYYFHIIPVFFDWSQQRSSDTIENMLVCIEMTALATLHFWTFSYTQYRTNPGENTLRDALQNITHDILSQHQLARDAKDAFVPKSMRTSPSVNYTDDEVVFELESQEEELESM